jgi:hypothetical protein
MKPAGRNALVALAVAVVAAGALALPAAAAYGGPLPSFHNLFKGAVDRLHAKANFKNAVMLEADGRTKGNRPVAHARGIVRVRFVFDNQGTHGSRFASAFINYGPPPKLFGKIHGVTSPFLEDRHIPHPPKMTLKRAVKLLRGAGFHDKFANVTLRKPLTKHTHTHPLYIFGFGRGQGQTYVAVDTKTGTVAPIS